MANPNQSSTHQLEEDYKRFMDPYTPRKSSTTSTTSSSPSSTPSSQQSTPSTIQTRSDGCPSSPGLIFERPMPASPRSDDDLIFVAVKLRDKFRRASMEGSPDLPCRPRKRPFLLRLTSRLLGSCSADEEGGEYKAIKMPRSAYKAHFARNAQRNYVGTEPEREWSEEALLQEFGCYQDVGLRGLTC